MDLWTVFCGNHECSYGIGKKCSSGFWAIFFPNSCINHVLVISIDILLLFIFLFVFISTRKIVSFLQHQRFSPLLILSVSFNAGLGLIYLGLVVSIIIENVSTNQTSLPPHGWVVMLFQGITWLSLSLFIGLMRQQVPGITMRICSVLGLLCAGFICIPSLWEAIFEKVTSVKNVLDILSFPGAMLLLLCAFQQQKYTKTELDIGADAFYSTLQGEEPNGISKINSDDSVTPFANAGFVSRMSFWWLNPLMKKGKEKTIQDKDVPQLCQADQAETCYLMFMEQLSKRKQTGSIDFPSVVLTIFFCHWKAISISGFFALIRVLTLAAGPVLLKSFIEVAEGKEAFKYEAYALTAGLFLAKCLESLSERQWYFRARLIGLQVRSLLSAAIYQKQLQLSNAAKMAYSPGEIINFVAVDAYRIGEFPYWFHQIWTTCLQICLALVVVYFSIGLATIAALVVIIITVLANYPLAKLQLKYQTKLMVAQDKLLKTFTEALANMKVLKLYAWETHFRRKIEGLRKEEFEWLSAVQILKGYNIALFWLCPTLVPIAAFGACYFLGIPINASNVFTFLATLRIVQEPIRLIPDVAGAFVEAKVSLARIVKFLGAPELQKRYMGQKCDGKEIQKSIFVRCSGISWDINSVKATLRSINLAVKPGEKVAICGEVGSGKSTLLAAILGEVPKIDGIVEVYGKMTYVSQTAWIQTGTIQENILFGSAMDQHRYQEVLEKCSLVKDLEMLPFGDLTQIGERGVNLSGGQKQRLQLARALYHDADIYLLDDPFSAVDAKTAISLFNEYVMGALSGKTVLLVTHQVDFLPAFDSVLLMSDGEILGAATYNELMVSSQEFQNLVNAHNDTADSDMRSKYALPQIPRTSKGEIQKIYSKEKLIVSSGEQLIKQEERETGDTGLKPYIQYLKQGRGFLLLSLGTIGHIMFIVGQLIQGYWLAANLQNSSITRLKLIAVYSVIGCSLIFTLFLRSFFVVFLGLEASKSIFSTLMNSLFRAPMSFYDSTPLGRILSRVSLDLSIIDLDVAFCFTIAVGSTMNTYSIFGVLSFLTWQILLVIIPMVYLIVIIQRYYFASAKEFMRINGTTKSLVASHLAESIAGAMTIRAFGEEDRFFSKNLDLIDKNASPFFHSFSVSEWLIQRLEILCAIVLSSSALGMTLGHLKTSASGYIGMALSYGLSLNVFLSASVRFQCTADNLIISVERLEQYMHIPSEAPEVIETNRPPLNWPTVGKVEISDLKVRYRPNAPLVLRGISCTFEGGHKIGIVGRTGSGKTTLISSLFRLVEPTEGKIIIDGLDISQIGLHDLRSHFGIIPQDPTLFSGSVRYNIDPLSEHTDREIWEVLEKCQLKEAVQEKEEGLNSSVVQDGSNWSMGQRQLVCLGRALLRRSRILVLDEATASIDNATDSILQKTIRTEFQDSTVITVAHRIPTVMDCTMVLAISDGKLVEYDEPLKLMNKEGSLFGQLVRDYWSYAANASIHSEDWK